MTTIALDVNAQVQYNWVFLQEQLFMFYNPPRIVCAAVRYPDGKMLVGPRHFDYTMLLQHQALKIEFEEGESEKGFVDQEGKFYTRQEAWKLAEANGQILYRPEAYEKQVGTLFSEHLY